AAALAGLVSGYHLYAIETARDARHRDVFQPAWANLRFLLTAGSTWRVRVGEGGWQRVSGCALFGPSSHVTWSESTSGIVVRVAPPAERALAIDPGYTDYSHFVRDAHEFLGMSPQAFLKLDNPLFVQSAKLRSAVLGAPAQALGAG